MAADPANGPIVVDANILFSALVKDGTTRQLILHPLLDLHTPEYLWEEMDRNRQLLLRKSGVTEATLDLLIGAMKERIRNIPLDVIRPQMKEAEARLRPSVSLDAPYVAAALAIGGAVWTHDKPLGKRAGVPILHTRDLLRLLES